MLSCDYKKNTEMETNTNQKVSCVVNYSYDASETDELTIRPGDILREVERLPGGWWRGELRGRWGMFPDNFVSVLTEQNNARPSSVQGRCRAVYSYQPANPDELPLSVGDVLEVLNEVEEGWWKGRRSGRVGVFPSNFVVMLDASPTPAPPAHPAPPVDPAPALPPKPVKELCRVLFPYSAVNEDELNLSEGDVVTIVSKEAPDRGWWKGELQGRVGFFPDNFVQLLPAVAHEVEEKKPDRPPSKTNTLYPVLNKYSEKTASVKELITSKISMHKENSKEITSQSNITQTSKNETEKIIHSESVDGSPDGQMKKPPVPLKKSPTPGSMSGLLSGLKNKMMSSTDKTEKIEKNTVLSSSGEWDKTDGISASKTSANINSNSQHNSTNTFDHIERNSILNDPRAGRVKAPRRRPPSQSLRDDTPQQIGLSNGHEVPPSPASKEEIRPRAREWEKHRAPWMAELKLNQARKTSSGTDARTKPGDRTSEGGLEEKRTSHSMEMSKSTSSISNRISVLESLECSLETKMRTSETKKDSLPPELPTTRPPSLQSPTAAGRTITSMLDEVRKPPAPAPPTPATPAVALMAPATGLVTPAAGLVSPAVGLVTPAVGLVTPAAPLATLISPLAASAATPAGPLAPPVAARLSDTDRSPKHDKTDRFPSLDRSDKSEVIKSSGLEKSTDKVNDVTKSSAAEKSEKVNDISKLTSSSSTDKFNDVQPFSVIAAFSAIEKSVERNEVTSKFSSIVEKNTSIEKNGRTEMSRSNTLEMKAKSDKECSDVLIAQLNDRILNLEKLIEVQNAKFNTAIEDLSNKLKHESEKRQALQMEIEKLAHCVTQV